MAISADDIRSFNEFLYHCSDEQVQGVYDKETRADRPEYAALAEGEARRRGLTLIVDAQGRHLANL